MNKRMPIETMPDGSESFRVDGEVLTMRNTRVFALIEHVASGISEAVVRDAAGRFVRITSVLGGSLEGRTEQQEGWYVTDRISEVDANLLRQSWTVLIRQPEAPDALKGD